MPTLADLPGDIIVLLAIELESESEDFFNLRLTCKHLNSKSLSRFLSCYFKTRSHMLDRQSLHNLLEISAHPVFGPSLRTLQICVEHLTEEPPLYAPLPDWEWELGIRVLANVDKEAYKRCFEDQKRLRECGLDTAYLTRALINLPNCKMICVNDSHWPWGAVSLKRQTGVFPTSSMKGPESIYHVKRTVQVVLAAIMASQVSLDLLDIDSFDRQAISPEMLPLWSDICLGQPLSQRTPLTSLALSINSQDNEDPNTWANDLVDFIGLFPALQKLLLLFHPHDRSGRLTTLSTRLRLQSLWALLITSADCTEEDLATLFLGHKDTLRYISLECVNIKEGSGSWTSLESTVQKQLSVEKFRRIY